MKTKIVTQTTITRILKSCKAAGLDTSDIIVKPNGEITLKTREVKDYGSSKRTGDNDWDEILEE